VIRRGSIHLVDLEPSLGAEANKVRPAVIVSNDAANATAQQLGRGVVTVVPVTSNVLRVYPFQVFLTTTDSGLRLRVALDRHPMRPGADRRGRRDRHARSRRRDPHPPRPVTRPAAPNLQWPLRPRHVRTARSDHP
jgi:mRNA-degrading endonuclease toxin of MazEF toxin-antitoxin module